MPGERATSLREVEALFFRLITAPEGVAPGLEALGLSPGDLERVVCSDARRSATGRLDVYANMYFFRIRDALRELYPALAAAMGEAGFHNLVTDYLLAHPSESPSLRDAGARLPDFLAGREPAWLAELARLERARVEVFDGPDAEPLTLEALRARPAEAFARLWLALIPSLRRLEVGHAVDEVWEAAVGGREIEPPGAAPRSLIVWRRDVEVQARALDAEEAALLALAADGTSFGIVCDRLAERHPDEDGARLAERAFQLLGRWVDGGMLRAERT